MSAATITFLKPQIAGDVLDTQFAVFEGAAQLTPWVPLYGGYTDRAGFGFGAFGSGTFGVGGYMRANVDSGFGRGMFGHGSFGTWEEPISVTLDDQSNGAHTYSVEIQDANGNSGSAIVSGLSITIDEAPQVPIAARLTDVDVDEITLVWTAGV